MLIYRINPLKELKNKANLNQTVILRERVIPQSVIANMRHGNVTEKSIEYLCKYLNVKPGDIIDYIDDDQYKVLWDSGFYNDSDIPMMPPKQRKENSK